ncbi:MAG: gas vesicle protein GvpG [Chloroflexi bacterium]|nr:gas vesicle protein GvpG [Chloroflexota bacterium]
MNILTLPILGGPRLVSWLADKTTGEARDQFLDERRVRGELLKLQQLYDAGEMEEEEYDRHEKALLEELNVIRELKAQLRDQG